MSEVVVVTGASAGVGRATAIEFARHGAKVGLIARGQAGLEAAAKDVEQSGGQAHHVVCDVADHDQLEAAAREIEQVLGPIDVWVNNAMVTLYAPFTEITPEEYRRVTDVTYLGSVWGIMVALRRMRERDHGSIVQVGSAMAYRGIPLQAPYCGAKHALNGMIDSVRTELMHEGSNVHVSIVQLPGLNTPQFKWGRSKLDRHPQPVPPIFQPEVAAEAIHYAAHSNRREVWVGGPTVQTVLGDRFASGLVDRVLAATGVSSQQTDDVHTPQERRDNLFEPVDTDVDFGVHGPFDSRAKNRSLYAKASEHRGALAVAGAALGAVATVAGAAIARRGDAR